MSDEMNLPETESTGVASKSALRRYGLPAGLLAGGIALGSVLMPIGLANAENATTTTSSDDSTSRDAGSDDTSSDSGRDGRGGFGRGGMMFGGGAGSKVVQELLGMTHEEIHAALDSGQTLAQLAESKGVTQADLVAALVAEATERIDQAVADGRIDEARATEMKTDLETRIAERVASIHEARQGRRDHHRDASPDDATSDETTTTTES